MTISPIAQYQEDPFYWRTLSELSEAKSTERCVAPDSVAGRIKAFSLDEIKADRCRNYGYPRGGLSSDAFLVQNDVPVLIEFKTSSVGDAEWFRTIYDSVILLVELGVLSWAESREKLEFILVQKDVAKYIAGDYEGNPDRDARVLEGQVVKSLQRMSPEAFESYVAGNGWAS